MHDDGSGGGGKGKFPAQPTSEIIASMDGGSAGIFWFSLSSWAMVAVVDLITAQICRGLALGRQATHGRAGEGRLEVPCRGPRSSQLQGWVACLPMKIAPTSVLADDGGVIDVISF